jgi:hypothetical protein
MSRRRPSIARRKRVFLGCEGKSEAGYGGLVAQIGRDSGTVFIDVKFCSQGPAIRRR